MSLLAGLDAHAQRLAGSTIAGLVESDPARARDFALRLGPLYASFARQRYDREALDALFAIAGQADLPAAMRRQFDGETINPTEGRAVLHSALRGDNSTAPVAREARAQAVAAQARMRELIAELDAGDVTEDIDLDPQPIQGGLQAQIDFIRAQATRGIDMGQASNGDTLKQHGQTLVQAPTRCRNRTG